MNFQACLAAVLFASVCSLEVSSTPVRFEIFTGFSTEPPIRETICNNRDFEMCLHVVRNLTIRINFHSEITNETCSDLEKGVSCLQSFQEACDIENKVDFTTMVVIQENSVSAHIACLSKNQHQPKLNTNTVQEKSIQPSPPLSTDADSNQIAGHPQQPMDSDDGHGNHTVSRNVILGSGGMDTNFLAHSKTMHTPCYGMPQIKKCEEKFAEHVKIDEHTKIDDETCKHYRLYHNCIENIIIMKCDLEEHLHLEHYLMEHAKFLVWKCPEADVLRVTEAHLDVGTALSPLFRMKNCVDKMKGMFGHCRKNLHHNLEVAARMTTNTTTYMEKKCCAITEFFDCTRVVVLMKCGLKGGKIIVDSIRSYQEHDNAECKGFESSYFTRCSSACERFSTSFFVVSVCHVLHLLLHWLSS